MTKPSFLLGVGAQKAGTSFLYRALSEHPDVALSTPKEMHVFDAVFMPDFAGSFRRRRIEAVKERFEKETLTLSRAAKKKTSDMLRHLRMYYDLEEYRSYFRSLATDKVLTGDITPSYSILKEEHFAEIRALLKDDFAIKVVFLMRDPVDRIYSAMRMDDRNGTTKTPAHQRFSKTYADEKHRRRTEYHKTIKALDAAFPAEEIHYSFYENLFSAEPFSRLMGFIGIDGLTPDFGTRINASPTNSKLTQAQIDEARAFYEPTYRFCLDKFGADKLRSLWAYA